MLLAVAKAQTEESRQFVGQSQNLRRFESWQELEISFLSDERIQISFPGGTENYNYAEFDFQDDRNGKPKRAWILLRALAENDGILKLSTIGELDWPPIGKRVQEIRKVFREHFQLSEDPLPFIENVGYQAQFKIRCSESYQT